MLQHQHNTLSSGFAIVAVVTLLMATAAYATAVGASRRRGSWPAHRSLLWAAGVLCAAVAVGLPLTTDGHGSFTTHMVTHLLLGMLAPLLLVLSAPVTLVLRALPAAHGRRLSRLLRSPLLRVLTHPVVAAVLNVGGLWWLYATDLFHEMHQSGLLYAVVHVHLLVVGYVFTASIIGQDPDPHRASMGVRSIVLVLFMTAHAVLAKWLYGHAPAGVGVDDARLGAQLMYYGGDAVDLVIIVVLFAQHHASARTRAARTRIAA